MTAPEVIAVLEAIDRGELTVKRVGPDDTEYYPEYAVSNGWTLRIFDDCGQWDYVDSVAPLGGDVLDNGTDFPFVDWRPRNLAAWDWAPDGLSPAGYIATDSP